MLGGGKGGDDIKALPITHEKEMEIMRASENWDVLCEACDKTIERRGATESENNYCESCFDKLAYRSKDK
ncbi:hypothetical protein ACWKT1_23175 [Bacillus cereus]